MDKIQKSAVIAVLFLSLAVIVMGVLPATAVDVVVTRDLPDEPVAPNDDVVVNLTQSGFYLNVGTVTEKLPEGFIYVPGSTEDSEGNQVFPEYDETKNELIITFENVTAITYLVEAGTEEQIKKAAFFGTWETPDQKKPTAQISGTVTGDEQLTFGESPTPTPGNGNGGGGSGGATTPTATPTATATATPGETPSPSPTATPSVSPSASPVTTATPLPTPSPTKKPLIPGFEAVFAIASLLLVMYLVLRRRKGE